MHVSMYVHVSVCVCMALIDVCACPRNRQLHANGFKLTSRCLAPVIEYAQCELQVYLRTAG